MGERLDDPPPHVVRYRLRDGERPPVSPEQGPATRDGRGLFAEALLAAAPLLAVEEEGRLNDPTLRENWIEGAFAYRRLRTLFAGRWTQGDLVAFHTAHKLQLMAHAPQDYAALGRLVAEGKRHARDALREALRDVDVASTSCTRWGRGRPSRRRRAARRGCSARPVVAYLEAALDLEGEKSEVIETGGADAVSYGDLMREYARQVGLRRLIVPVPVLTPRLSALWLALLTPVYRASAGT